MEIKRGISQMAEYPNVEINYVVPKSGNMHYVLKEGILDNGVIIATLDPRHAIDEGNPCQNIGVFSATGDVLVDFNKKDIKKITDNLLLVVNSVPTTNLVATPDDMEALSNKDLIVQMMMQEMGPTGEIIFEDPYSEANVYATDSYNNKVGIDCSFIGKNNEGLYFHTNDVNSLSKFIKVDEFSTDSGSTIENEFSNVSLDNIPEEPITTNTEDISEEEDLQLNINPTILGGFNIPQDESIESEINSVEEPTELQITENNTEISDIGSEVEEQTQPESNEEPVEDNTVTEETTKEESQAKSIEDEDSDESIEESADTKEDSKEEAQEEFTEDEDSGESSEESTDTKEDSKEEVQEESTEDEDSDESSEESTDTKEDSKEEAQEESTEDEDSDESSEESTDTKEDSKEEPEEESTEDDDSEEEFEDYDDDDEYEKEEEEDDIDMEKSRRNTRRKSILDNENNDVEILDEAIDIINKMMEETDKLNKRIKKLEARLDEKEQLIQEQTELIEEQDNKKSELNNILNKASRLLENIE